MFKFLLFLIFIFSLPGTKSLYAQTDLDSLKDELNDETLIRPITDSGYIFADTLRRVSVQQLKSYVLNPDYAYANDPEYWRKEPPQKPGILGRILNSSAFWWILVLIAAGIAVTGIYQLAKENSFNWWARKGKNSFITAGTVLLNEKADYDAIILQYQEEGNYRMAVRYLYLRLIETLREKNEIQIRDSSTNAEIVRAFGNQTRADDFRFLARAYEFIFYGGFLPGRQLFDTVRKKFDSFQQIHSV